MVNPIRLARVSRRDLNRVNLLSPGTYKILNSGILRGYELSIDGVILQPDDGVTITFDVDVVSSPVTQLFDLSAGGNVVFASSSKVSEVYCEWWGALGDGSTDDTRAIKASLASAKALNGKLRLVPGKSYGLHEIAASDQLIDSCEIVSEGATIKKVGASVSNFISTPTGSANVKVSGITFEADGLVTTTIFRLFNDAVNFTMSDCRFVDASGEANSGFETRDRAYNVLLENCQFDVAQTGVFINRDPVGVEVRGCVFRDWGNRAIYTLGSSTLAARRVRLIDNKILDVDTEGTTRQPISFAGDDSNPFQDIEVIGNYVEGPALDYGEGGTADQISLHRCTRFIVRGNHVINGGAVGITISEQCDGGIVAGNVCAGNDGAGIALGANGISYVRNVAVSGNLCINNGQDRADDATDVSRSGIRTYNAENCIITGNILSDNQTPATQQYGLYYNDATNLEIGGNIFSGNEIGTIFGEGTNAEVGEGHYGLPPADQVAANEDTSEAILADLETEVNEIKAALRTLGLLASA